MVKTTIKLFESYINYKENIEKYLKQTVLGDFEELTPNLFDLIAEEGFVEDLESTVDFIDYDKGVVYIS